MSEHGWTYPEPICFDCGHQEDFALEPGLCGICGPLPVTRWRRFETEGCRACGSTGSVPDVDGETELQCEWCGRHGPSPGLVYVECVECDGAKDQPYWVPGTNRVEKSTCHTCFGTGRVCEEIEDERVDEVIRAWGEYAITDTPRDIGLLDGENEFALAVHRARQERKL